MEKLVGKSCSSLPSKRSSEDRSQVGNDLLIKNGMVMDGMGKPAFRADVIIRGERIKDVGLFPEAQTSIAICDSKDYEIIEMADWAMPIYGRLMEVNFKLIYSSAIRPD